MFQGKRILAMIPARGGSKGIPGKNIISLAGKPLIAWTIESALKCDYIDKLVVSTGDEEISQIAQKYGRRYFGSWMHADTARSIITTAAADVIRDDLEYNRDSIALVNDWITASTERGWGIYRMHTVGMDQARAAYSFNDHALLRLHEAIKDTLDPVGIFSPGKNGIWPKHMRRDKA